MKAMTDKQIEVLEMVIEGLSAKQIARKLNISTRTVENHKKAITNAFSCSSFIKIAFDIGKISA